MSDLGPISEASEISLAAATLDARDGSAAALVRRYSALIDEAAIPAKYEKALSEFAALARMSGTKEAYDALRTVTAALSEQSVTSDLGPKLLAALTALGCTLAGRGAKGKETARAADPRRAAHDELRERRAARKNHTTA
jgi:hypothetical protein